MCGTSCYPSLEDRGVPWAPMPSRDNRGLLTCWFSPGETVKLNEFLNKVKMRAVPLEQV